MPTNTPPRPMKRAAVTVLKWAVTAGTLAYLVLSGRLRVDGLRVADDGWGWVVGGAALVAFLPGLGVWRFHVMLRGAGVWLPWRASARIGLIGAYFNLVGPGGVGGDVVRTGYAMAVAGRRAAPLAAALMDRYVGLLGLAFLGSVAAGWAWPALRGDARLWALAAASWGLLFGLTVGLAVLAQWGRPAHDWLARRGWSGTRMAVRMLDAVLAYRDARATVAAGVGISVLFHVMLAAGLACLGRGLAEIPYPPTVAQTAMAAPITFLANSLPLPGGGLGVGEAVFDELLRSLSAPTGRIVSGGATLFLAYRLLVVPFALVGLPLYWRAHTLVDDARRAYADAP